MTQDAPQIGVVVGGKYRVARVLGKGGMGVVVAAHNQITGKQVAIKWMHAAAAAHHDAVQRLIQEAAASARVRHPNVVDVYDVIHDDTGVFLVMEYLNGEPLTGMLERGGMPVSELISVLIGAMRGVAAAHRAGVIHRDIKPDNIFLIRGEDGQCIPKVLDFGISKITDHVGPSLTQTGTALGTPMYMSCEQLRNARDVDGRADVYAFGVILYEAVTGQSPFPGDSFAEVVAKIMTTEPATPKSLSENLPDELDQVIRQAMAKNREDRIRSMEEFIRALQPFATEPKFQLEISDEDPAPPIDPSMVTALTPAARNVLAHASTLNRPEQEGLRSVIATPSGAFQLRERREHSGMVNLDVPPPAGVPPTWSQGDDSLRPGHQTLDPRTTTHGDRPRHVGIISLLTAAVALVGVGALLWPSDEGAGVPKDGHSATTSQPTLPTGQAPTQIQPPQAPLGVPGESPGVVAEPTGASAATPKQTTADGSDSISGEVAASGAKPNSAQADTQNSREDVQPETKDEPQDKAKTAQETAQERRAAQRASRRHTRDNQARDREANSAYVPVADVRPASNRRMPPAPPAPPPPEETGSAHLGAAPPEGTSVEEGSDPNATPQPPSEEEGNASTSEADAAPSGTEDETEGANAASGEDHANTGDDAEDRRGGEQDEESKPSPSTRWRAGELRRDEF